jgi:hypothetical protein
MVSSVYLMLDLIMKLSDFHLFDWTHGRKDVKVLRHRDPKTDLWELRRASTFGDYQDGQSWDVFGRAKYVISFIAERNCYAKFVGVWQVEAKSRKPTGGFKYTTLELPGYSELGGRLIVEWGEGTRSWAQWLHTAGDKTVTELLPQNYVMDFPGFYNFILSYDQLTTMIANPDSNREWQRMLSSVSGVYVILHQSTGKQYIGSAYGAGGIWERWASYAKSPCGGNHLLRELLRKDPSSHKSFRFSVLRVFESGTTSDEVLGQEALMKQKLGSRTFGLNSN